MILVVAAVLFVAAYLYAKTPAALYNSDPDDAKSVYFSSAGLAVDSNRLLFNDEELSDELYDGTDLQIYEYEYGIVTEILDESVQQDPDTENVHLGTQYLSVQMQTGRYEGQTFTVENRMSKLFDKHASVGTRLLLNVYTNYTTLDENGDPTISVSVTNYNRTLAIYGMIALFLIVTILVGGKVGARSILGLLFTIVCIVCILVPLLLKGFSAVGLTFLIAIYTTIVCFVLLDGVSAKTLSAILGTIAGFAVAALFAYVAGRIMHIDGLELATNETDTLVQAKYQGYQINIRGLFVSGVIIASMGAVMDVAMSISSAVNELRSVNGSMGSRDLFRSGMNIGRDAVGTMTNTLVLAFTGSALVDFVLIYINGWSYRAIINNDFIASELIIGLAGSTGIILAVPLTAFISSLLAPLSERIRRHPVKADK